MPVNRLRRAAALAAATVILGVAAAACGSDTPTATDAVTVPASIPVHSGPRQPLEGFQEVTVTVTAPDGTTRQFCLLLAADAASHERGLMFVTDLTLGGYDGMLFQFDRDSSGGFWMKNTRIPLSIAYLGADGSIVSTADMEPCPDGTERCPGYPPDGPYRYALEVVQGRLDELGLVGDARLTVGGTGCAPVGEPDGAGSGSVPTSSST